MRRFIAYVLAAVLATCGTMFVSCGGSNLTAPLEWSDPAPPAAAASPSPAPSPAT